MPEPFQIQLEPDGDWHRQRNNGQRTTACGKSTSGAFATRDHHRLDGKLCRLCFTPHERDTGEMKKIEKRALEHAEADAFGDDDDHKTPIEPVFDHERKEHKE